MILLVHGGARSRKPSAKKLRKLAEALSSGFRILHKGESALDAVSESIRLLEDSGTFNAGSGGNLQFDGVRRLDASLMDGSSLNAGSVVGLEGIRNPVLAAMSVMHTPHVILAHKGAKRMADASGLALLPKPTARDLDKLKQIRKKKTAIAKFYKAYFSTVGAVAIDIRGNLAAGASTGGVMAMLPGRVGDTPVIGAGIYADNRLGAVACTGIGEYIVKLSLAKEIIMNMKNMSAYRASSLSLRRLRHLGGQAGVIVLDRKGHFSIMHTTPYMPSGYATERGLTVKEGFKGV